MTHGTLPIACACDNPRNDYGVVPPRDAATVTPMTAYVKRFAALILALSTVGLVAACSDAAPESTTQTEAATAGTTAPQAKVVTFSGDRKVTAEVNDLLILHPQVPALAGREWKIVVTPEDAAYVENAVVRAVKGKALPVAPVVAVRNLDKPVTITVKGKGISYKIVVTAAKAARS